MASPPVSPLKSSSSSAARTPSPPSPVRRPSPPPPNRGPLPPMPLVRLPANSRIDPSNQPFKNVKNHATMFNLGKNPKVRGSGHLVLNALRAFNIIALAAIMVSSWVMVVLSGLKGHFYFFDTASHIFVFLFAVFLTITELTLFKGYFEDNWPVFRIDHSLAWLGVFMVMLGCQVLGNLDKEKYNQENLTLPMWRLVLASGILAIAFGFFNIIASIVFRDGSQGITARHIRRDGSLATADNKASMYEQPILDGGYQRSPAASYRQEKEEEVSRFRRATRMINPMNLPKSFNNFRKSRMEPLSEKRVISNPMPVAHDVERGGSNYESPMPVQPDPMAHPAFQGDRTYAAPSSRYSLASIDRFSEAPGRDRTHDRNYL